VRDGDAPRGVLRCCRIAKNYDEEEITERIGGLLQCQGLPAQLLRPRSVVEFVEQHHVVVAAFNVDGVLKLEEIGKARWAACFGHEGCARRSR